jgi:hypothetical protein
MAKPGSSSLIPAPETIPDPRRDALDVLTAEFIRKCEEIEANVHMLAISYRAADGKSYYRTRNFTKTAQLLEILFAFILMITPFDFEALRVALDTHDAFRDQRRAVEALNKPVPKGKAN